LQKVGLDKVDYGIEEEIKGGEKVEK